MKKLVLILCVLLLSLAPAVASAEADLASMTFDQLVALRQEIDLLLFGSDQYKDVSVPQGVYIVGVDIPAGTYSFSSTEFAAIEIFSDESCSIQSYVAVYSVSADNPVAKFELKDGYAVEIQYAPILFTTYTGLGF